VTRGAWVVLLGLTVAASGHGDPVDQTVRNACLGAHVTFPPKRVFLRAFKQERQLELWGANAKGAFHLLRTYPIAAASGGPGPKRREGDMQVPEGVYRVARFNPRSRYHLSLGLDYPNPSDRVLGHRQHLGGDIFIHGNHVSAGCLAMTDPKIEEIYALCRRAAQPVRVHIFPCRLDGPTYTALRRANPSLVPFWHELEPIYAAFERSHTIPAVQFARDGSFAIKAR